MTSLAIFLCKSHLSKTSIFVLSLRECLSRLLHDLYTNLSGSYENSFCQISHAKFRSKEAAQFCICFAFGIHFAILK